jgi:hypothetical protein
LTQFCTLRVFRDTEAIEALLCMPIYLLEIRFTVEMGVALLGGRENEIS